MWILISFAMIALVIFLIMTVLKIEPLISIVVSVLTGLILAYFFERLTITYDKDHKYDKYHKYDKDHKDSKDKKDKKDSKDSKDSEDSKNVTSIQSTNSNNSNSSFESSMQSTFDYFKKNN